MPPMPRLATNAVILTPRLSKINKTVAAQIINWASHVMFLSIAALVGSFFRGLLGPFTNTVGSEPLEDLRDLDGENDDDEALHQDAEVFWQGQEEGAEIQRGDQIDNRSDDASKQVVEQIIKVVRRPLREGLQAPQDDRPGNRQDEEDADEDPGGGQVLLDRVLKKLAVHAFGITNHSWYDRGGLTFVTLLSPGSRVRSCPA